MVWILNVIYLLIGMLIYRFNLWKFCFKLRLDLRDLSSFMLMELILLLVDGFLMRMNFIGSNLKNFLWMNICWLWVCCEMKFMVKNFCWCFFICLNGMVLLWFGCMNLVSKDFLMNEVNFVKWCISYCEMGIVLWELICCIRVNFWLRMKCLWKFFVLIICVKWLFICMGIIVLLFVNEFMMFFWLFFLFVVMNICLNELFLLFRIKWCCL